MRSDRRWFSVFEKVKRFCFEIVEREGRAFQIGERVDTWRKERGGKWRMYGEILLLYIYILVI